MVIDEVGNVGIGTVTPDYPFVVAGSCSGDCALMKLVRQSDGYVYYDFTNTYVSFGVGDILLPTPQGGATTMSATGSTGNGGTFLSITGPVYFNQTSGTAYNVNMGSTFAGSSTASYVDTQITPTLNFSGSGNYTTLYINPTETAVGSGTNYLLNAAVGGTSKFALTTSGNVGIGTASPQSALHIPDGKYLQAEDNNAGAPASGDCDSNTERGRLSIDTTNNRLYVCNGATRGWDYVALTN